jgi:hypothetical protein
MRLKIEQAPVPAGIGCAWCDEPIAPDDEGYMVPHMTIAVADLPWHVECQARV